MHNYLVICLYTVMALKASVTDLFKFSVLPFFGGPEVARDASEQIDRTQLEEKEFGGV